MAIAGLLGAANQATINSMSYENKPVSDANNNVSFLGVAREVAENLSGKIVVANRGDAKGPDFMKAKFEYEIEMPEKIDNVYDFIAEIKKIMKDKRR